jgi:hypothetical protein
MEEALFIWFKQMSDRELAITDEMLVEKANEIGKLTNVPEGFKFSSGWLYNWKKRHGVHVTVRHGEAAAADQAGVLLARESVRKVVEGYGEENISNQDESGLFWRQVPTRTLAQGKKAGLKKDKQRITVSFTCNATGTDKRPLFIIGKSKRPRSFPKNFQPQRDWGIRYRNNSKAWMLSKDYSDWLKEWNSKLCGYVVPSKAVLMSFELFTLRSSAAISSVL